MRARRRQGAAGKQPDLQPVDDWLGDVSDEDWSEEAATFAERRRATPVPREPSARQRYADQDAQALPSATTKGRSAVERRRAVAALVLLVLCGAAAAAAVLLLRDGADAPVTTAESTTVTTPTETDPVQTTPSTTPTETTPTEPTESASFTLPEGTKLQRGESVGESDLVVSTDPELIADLQRALTTAGFDPGTPDGDFGLNTEAAVVAFQQANGLPPDGIVGPETAEALNSAVAGG